MCLLFSLWKSLWIMINCSGLIDSQTPATPLPNTAFSQGILKSTFFFFFKKEPFTQNHPICLINLYLHGSLSFHFAHSLLPTCTFSYYFHFWPIFNRCLFFYACDSYPYWYQEGQKCSYHTWNIPICLSFTVFIENVLKRISLKFLEWTMHSKGF